MQAVTVVNRSADIGLLDLQICLAIQRHVVVGVGESERRCCGSIICIIWCKRSTVERTLLIRDSSFQIIGYGHSHFICAGIIGDTLVCVVDRIFRDLLLKIIRVAPFPGMVQYKRESAAAVIRCFYYIPFIIRQGEGKLIFQQLFAVQNFRAGDHGPYRGHRCW